MLSSWRTWVLSHLARRYGARFVLPTLVGVAAHAVATNIRKRHLIKEEMRTSEDVKDARAEQGGD